MREAFLEQFLAANLGRYDGAVFFFCHRDDSERRAMLIRAAQAAGREIMDVPDRNARAADPAARCGRHAFFVSFPMLDELEHYLSACPRGARHLLICSRHGGKRIIHSLFWDFFEERGAEASDIDAPAFFRDRSWWLMRILVHLDDAQSHEIRPDPGLPAARDTGRVLLARIEGLKTVEEQKLCPSLYDLSVRELLEQLERLRETGCFLLYSRDFSLSVLKTAYRRCGKKPFPAYYLTLEDLMESLDLPAPEPLETPAETLPAPSASWPNDPPKMPNRCMQSFYQLVRTLLYHLETEQ